LKVRETASPLVSRRLSRRRVLKLAAAAGAGIAGAALVGCSGDDDDDEATRAAEAPTVPTTDQPTTATPAETATAAQATEEPMPAPPALAPSWQQLSPTGQLPPARRDHSLVASSDGSSVILFGGRDDGGTLGDTWLYETESQAWSPVESEIAPPPRFGHNAVLDPAADQVLLFGGQADGFFSDVWAIPFTGGGWAQLAADGDGPSSRYGAGGAYDVASGALFVSHGFTDSGRFDDTWAFNAAGGSWLDASPTAGERPVRRCLHRLAADPDAGRLLLFGGQTNDVQFLSDLWAYDLASAAWGRLDVPGPSGRNFYAWVHRSDGPYLVLFGGRTEAGENNELWLFDLAAGSWTRIEAPGPPSPRYGHDAATLSGGNILVFGGLSGGLLNDLWLLTFG
jgi:Galactose oxidase, central domain